MSLSKVKEKIIETCLLLVYFICIAEQNKIQKSTIQYYCLYDFIESILCMENALQYECGPCNG